MPKRVKIGAFWQDIVYEILPILRYRCGRLGHKEVNCSEPSDELKHPTPHGLEPSEKPGLKDSETTHTPWKTVQTRRSRSRGTNIENNPRGKLNPREPLKPINQRGHAPLTDSHVLRNQQIQTVTG